VRKRFRRQTKKVPEPVFLPTGEGRTTLKPENQSRRDGCESVLSKLAFFRFCPSTSTHAKVGLCPQPCHPACPGAPWERSRGTCCAPFPLTTPYSSVHPSAPMPRWRWMDGSTPTAPTRFGLSTFSSTHSASCAVQKAICALIGTALILSRPLGTGADTS
jgi:hypothetical protein